MDDDINSAEFEFDFCVACNMMLGMSFCDAQQEAKKWVEEAKED